MILSGIHAHREELDRFRREAEAISRLRHPQIVQIYAIGEHEGLPFFSLEYCERGSLDKRLQGTPLTPRHAAELIQKLADAVQAAHHQGVIHRDLKPANILLGSDDQPKISDFGLAKQLDLQSSIKTASGAIIGTPSYMAPEQARGETRHVGTAADVYSLGAILYELLTGRPPFKATTPMDTVLQVLEQEPVAPLSLNRLLPADLNIICLKCLEKDPERRYHTAQDLGDELARFLRGEPIHARAIGSVSRAARWCRRNPMVAGLSSAAACLLAAVAVTATVAYFREANLRTDLQQALNTAEANSKLANENAKAAKLAQDSETTQRRLAETKGQQLQIAKTDLEKSLSESRRLLGLSYVAYGRVCSLASRIANLEDSVLDQHARGRQISVQIKLQFKSDSDILMAAGNDAVKRAVTQFREALDKEGFSLEDHKRLKQLSLKLAHECGKAWQDSTRDNPDLRTKIRRGLYLQACAAADELAQASDFKGVEHFYQQFWELYWGELAIVESEEVESAMVALGKLLKPWRAGKAPPELTALAASLRKACKLDQAP
jgi:hypothetical protein